MSFKKESHMKRIFLIVICALSLTHASETTEPKYTIAHIPADLFRDQIIPNLDYGPSKIFRWSDIVELSSINKNFRNYFPESWISFRYDKLNDEKYITFVNKYQNGIQRLVYKNAPPESDVYITSHFPTLKKIYIKNFQHNNIDFVLNLKHLISIEVDNAMSLSSFPNFSELKNLENVSIHEASLQQESLNKIVSIPNLKTLNLSNIKGNIDLSMLSEIHSLQTLHLMNIHIQNTGILIPDLSQLRHLENLSICETQIEQKSIDHILSIPNLKHLSLCGIIITGSLDLRMLYKKFSI